MTSFLGFKLKGSSSRELETDLCVLWNNKVLSRCADLSALALPIKQRKVKNYSDGKNVAQCTSWGCVRSEHSSQLFLLSQIKVMCCVYLYIYRKKKILSFAPTWCQLLQQLLGYAIFEGNCYLMRL